MDGDDERTDKDSERSQPESPQNNSKTNTAIITDSSSGENGNQQRADRRRRRSRRNQRKNTTITSTGSSKTSKSSNREGHHIRQKVTSQSQENSSVPAQRRKRRRRNHQRKYKPYTKLSWEERMERDEAESERATRRRANRPTPYNTTQFLMEDHKADTPDLSGLAENHDNDTSEEIFEEDFRNGEYLEKNFSAVYDEVQSERLQSMTKEQLVNEVLALTKKVAELEESHRKLKTGQEIKCEDSRDGKPVDASVLSLSETLMDVPYPRIKKEVEKPTPEQDL